ncbi:MAG: hypothetical protein IT518_09010 [Burkholderiales bacterium]|nr:hypothetical protein [Burkholderiales bacterium]
MYHPTTFEPRDAGRREAAAARDAADIDQATAALRAAQEKGLAAIREAFAILIAEADLALAPVDGSADALDELRGVRDDALGMAEDALAAVWGEIARAGSRRAA